MQKEPSLLILLICCCFSGSQANRVYIHPFTLFAAENVSCETLQSPTAELLETFYVEPLDVDVLTPDARDSSKLDSQRQNITQRMAVLAGLLNPLGLRMFEAISRKPNSTNSLFSPVDTFETLVSFYLGASKKTSRSYLKLLGLSSTADREDCVSLVDGHKVLGTLQGINSLVDDDSEGKITTVVWAFPRKDANLSGDFIRGTQDFPNASFIRGVDFSQHQEAQTLVNDFVEKTSNGKVKDPFLNLDPNSNLLFLSSYSFKGNWFTSFQPDRSSVQEFYVDDATTVMVTMMEHTGYYHYLKDKRNRCTVVKLPLSNQVHMLLILPDKRSSLSDIESKLVKNMMEVWNQNLKERLLDLSVPRFSLSSVNDLHELLTNMDLEAELLGAQAEFSQLSNIQPFSIDKAMNSVTFEMAYEGSVFRTMEGYLNDPLKLDINRPFFFSVIENYYKSILLLGKVTNPSV